MNATLKRSIAVYAAALVVGLVAAASINPSAADQTPPSSHPAPMRYGFTPAAPVGLIGASVAAEAAVACLDVRPIYDRAGRFVGRQAVDVCD